MSDYAKWSEVKDKARVGDARTEDRRTAGKQAARRRREAYVRGHQLAEMRKAAGGDPGRPHMDGRLAPSEAETQWEV